MRDKLLFYACKYEGDYKRIEKAIKNEEEYEKIKYEGKYVCICDAHYPSKFKRLRYKPWVLFYEGDLSLVEQKMIAIVGSRENSEYGKECTQLLVQNMSKQYGVISGLAKGIDALAHTFAIYTNRKTIGVLGCGINVVYPKQSAYLYEIMKNEHLIISEYPNNTKPLAYHFPWRNRLIAALCEKLIVIEARVKSGTMITVSEAIELGKDIYAFPHSIFSENGTGCNLLIQQGCEMLNNTDDIKDL